MVHRKRSESGQSIVLLALGLVGLLGFLALAIDGGLLYFDRRGAQNAADAAALAAALAHIRGEDWQSAALARAASNGYNNDGTTNVIGLYSPPIRGPYAGDPTAIQIIITTTIRTNFAQLVVGWPVRQSAEAVSRAVPPRNIGGRYALWGNNPSACDAVWFHGSQATNINGGGVLSNSTGNDGSCASGRQSGSGDVTVTDGSIDLAGAFRKDGASGSVSPSPNTWVTQQSLVDIAVPDCSGLPNWGSKHVNKSTTLQPGVYTEIQVSGNNIIQLQPGMYCITGAGGFQAQGNGKIVGDGGVMIYLQNGGFDLGGGREVDLTAPSDLVDAAGRQWAKMLLYIDPGNTSLIKIRGNTGTTYTGTIYARGAHCDLSGTGDVTGYRTQVICDTIEVSGNAGLTIGYDEGDNYLLPPMVELTQ